MVYHMEYYCTPDHKQLDHWLYNYIQSILYYILRKASLYSFQPQRWWPTLTHAGPLTNTFLTVYSVGCRHFIVLYLCTLSKPANNKFLYTSHTNVREHILKKFDTNVLAEPVTILKCIWKISGLSLGQGTTHLNGSSCCFWQSNSCSMNQMTTST